MRSPEFDEDEADPEDNAQECQIISDEDIVYYKKKVDEYKADGRALVISPGYYALGDAANIPGPNLRNPNRIIKK